MAKLSLVVDLLAGVVITSHTLSRQPQLFEDRFHAFNILPGEIILPEIDLLDGFADYIVILSRLVAEIKWCNLVELDKAIQLLIRSREYLFILQPAVLLDFALQVLEPEANS